MRNDGHGMERHEAGAGPDRARYGAGGGHGAGGEGREHHDAVSYERTDASTRLILWTGGGLTALVIAASVAMLWLFNIFDAREDRVQVLPAPVARPAEQEPPEPRLQENPAADMALMRAEETRTLATYGWADQKAGIARIPIERAMERIVEHGLPERTKPAEPEANR